MEVGPSLLEMVATGIFAIAVLHTFAIKRFQHLAHQYPEGSIGENFFHLLGEVEVVFGFWAGVLMLYMLATLGAHPVVEYLESRNFTEPMFVFIIMSVAATKPVIDFAGKIIAGIARMIPINNSVAFYLTALIVGPLLGSFITEPAAMTVTAFILLERYYSKGISKRLMYITIGTLFVNVSIGGVLTNYAAPPVLMVAAPWDWSSAFMAKHFGWKAVVAVIINAGIAVAFAASELKKLKYVKPVRQIGDKRDSPIWLVGLHLLFLLGIVLGAHHIVIFFGLFLFFLGVVQITGEYQDALKLKESMLVGFFLAGLVVLGGFQAWWLKSVLMSLDEIALFIGTTALTAFTDNAALTYLGAQVEGLSDTMKYYLVAGAVAGGGLTVIANAPNPAGFTILQKSFGEEGISPAALALSALLPTAIALICFWILPSI